MTWYFVTDQFAVHGAVKDRCNGYEWQPCWTPCLASRRTETRLQVLEAQNSAWETHLF